MCVYTFDLLNFYEHEFVQTKLRLFYYNYYSREPKSIISKIKNYK